MQQRGERLATLRKREDALAERLEEARTVLRALRLRVTAARSAAESPYRKEQDGDVASAKRELPERLAEEGMLLRELERTRRDLAALGITRPHPLGSPRRAMACGVWWEEMQGDDRVRSCGRCGRRVYDLNGLGDHEAKTLVAEREHKACTKPFLRADGTTMVTNCPSAVRRRLLAVGGMFVAALIGAIGGADAAEREGRARAVPPRTYVGFPIETSQPAPTPTVFDESTVAPIDRAFLDATIVHPNRAKRLAAATALVAARSTSPQLLADREDLAQLQGTLESQLFSESDILEGAIIQGDVAGLKVVAQRLGSDWSRGEIRRNAWRCLLGQKETARGAFQAEFGTVDAGLNARLHRFGSAGNPDAHGLALACGMPLVPVTSDQELHRRAGALLLALGYKPASPLRGTDELDALLPVAMDVANGGDVAAALPVLREAYWRVLDRRFVSPDAILRGTMQSAYADILPLAVLEGAARRLQASGPEHATELHHVAWVFWLGAAAERARRGDMIGARAATAHAEALAIPGKLPLTVPLRLLEGDVSAADALVEKAWAQGGFSAAQHLQLRLYRVLVRIAGARWSDALDEAQPFYAASTAMPLVSQDWAERATWLYVALRLHQGLPHLELNAPPRGSLGAAGFWSRTAERPEDERHKIRVEEGWVSRAFFSTDAVVRAYALYVVGRAADGAGDVDVWLDAMTPLGLPARVYFWERSMAAWMRGDEKAAGEWTARGKQMAALIHDDTTAVLASMAGY